MESPELRHFRFFQELYMAGVVTQVTRNVAHSSSVTFPKINLSHNVLIAITVTRSRTDLNFSQRLREQNNSETLFVSYCDLIGQF